MVKGKKLWIIGLSLLVAFSLVGVGAALAQNGTQAPGATMPQLFWSKLAAKLGIDQAKLQEAVKAAAGETVDEAVQQGLLPADKAQRLRDAVANGEFPLPMHGFRGFHGFRAGGFLNDIAAVLGTTPQELRDELKAGKTLADIASAKGLTLERLKEKWLAQKKAELQKQVSQGKLTQEKADEILSRLEKIDLSNFAGPKFKR